MLGWTVWLASWIIAVALAAFVLRLAWRAVTALEKIHTTRDHLVMLERRVDQLEVASKRQNS